ncbi:hypothetical protein FYJ78_00485 [Selenomonas sp. WCA-380-WT-3B 3/]|uniref:Uncharacterized protein n=1 Tax=Selenomonas montiformis TaxID=2652285 RepID=A0A6I2UUC6_9FIRM|nr:hypothetical protein [Selenomonas montiformis]MSV23690.1 hypothetical protein [Selenomonas montiformis]
MADTMRWECSYETAVAEMCRCLGVSVHGVADSSREMVCTNEVMADTCRQVTSALQGASVNTLREIYADEQIVAGAVRILSRENSLAADVVRNLQATQAGMAKAARYVSKTESATQNFTRQVVKSETAIATTERIVNSPLQAATADTARRVAFISKAEAMTERDLSKWEVAHGDTVSILPYHFAIDANKGTGGDGIDDIPQQNISGIQSVTLALNERTLADTFQMMTASPLDIEAAVQGRILDFACDFQVEETSQQGILQTVKGMYPLDRLLYMPINIEVVEANCSYYARKIADALGLSLDLRIEDFTPSQDYSLSGMTYQDFISSLFSWTSRLPQRQINVFIRGGMLHIIQRGHEDQVTDITAWPHTMPTINRKLIRSVWDSATTESWDRARSDKDYEPQPFTGTIGIEGITRHYLNGLLTEEETNGSITEYSYDDQYLTEKRTHNPDGSTVQTTYTYAKTANDIYLFKETEKTTDATQKEGETSHDRNDWTDWLNENFSTRITYHAPIGYGWYSTTVYEDGEFQGSSISQGKPGGKSSQFTINEWNRSLGSDYDFDDDEDDKFKGQALFDTEFPVTGDDFLRELTHEIEWLNRKRQEEVSLDIVSPVIKGHATIRHILDFTERIRLDDKEYFLVSNQVKLTTRSLRQSIRLVRWYG